MLYKKRFVGEINLIQILVIKSITQGKDACVASPSVVQVRGVSMGMDDMRSSVLEMGNWKAEV